MCTNEVGSYSCSCSPGYRLASDGHGCIDIDECAEASDHCAQICINTIGSYTCSCSTGYKLLNDGQSCEGEHLQIRES